MRTYVLLYQRNPRRFERSAFGCSDYLSGDSTGCRLLFLANLAGWLSWDLGGRGRRQEEDDDRREEDAHSIYAPPLSADYSRKHARKREGRSVVTAF